MPMTKEEAIHMMLFGMKDTKETPLIPHVLHQVKGVGGLCFYYTEQRAQKNKEALKEAREQTKKLEFMYGGGI
jgi:hypothetical protein